MGEILFTNVFSNTKKSLNFKGYIFILLFIGLFLLFYELYNSECINAMFLIFFSTKDDFHIYQLIASKIIEIFFDSYIFYFFLTFVSDAFKNYLENSENNFAPTIFKKTIFALKERKLKFFGTIAEIYILFGIVMTAISYIFTTKTPSFFSYYYSPNMSIIWGTIIIILGVLIVSQILIVKTCFKTLGESTEKINFSKIIKIVGYGATYFAVFYFGVIYYMIIGFIISGQKVDIKKVFKFLPWKFVPVFLGIYKLNGQIRF